MKRILYNAALWVLSWLKAILIVWPMVTLVLVVMNAIWWFKRRRAGTGILVEKVADDYLFIPCTAQAKKTLHRYRAINGQNNLTSLPFFGVLLVPEDRYKEVYECVQHDPDCPQAVTQPCWNSPIPQFRHVQITEAPDGPLEAYWTVEDVMKHYGKHDNRNGKEGTNASG